MTPDINELTAGVRDALCISSLSAAQVAARLQARANGDPGCLLTAAIEIARELATEHVYERTSTALQ